MILCAEGVGQKLKWNEFVAVTMAGLASNVPEVIMIGFGVKAEPRVAFVVTCLTLRVTHVFAARGTDEARQQSAAFVEQGAAVVSCGELLSPSAPRGTGEFGMHRPPTTGDGPALPALRAIGR